MKSVKTLKKEYNPSKNPSYLIISKGLESLEGCPEVIDSYFNCSGNKLTDLKGGPKEVNGEYNCANNALESLEGMAEKIKGDFIGNINSLTSLKGLNANNAGVYLDKNHIKTMEGCPKGIKSLSVNYNLLTNLKGSPEIINGYFDCHHNQITSLEGAPTEITLGFNCSNNKLTSLEGGPKIVKRMYDCSDNNLNSLKGAPESCETLICKNNPELTKESLYDIMDCEIDYLMCDFIKNEEFKEWQELYKKADKNMRVFLQLIKLRDLK